MGPIVSAWAGGVVLGLGVAAPFGPINVEIVRRHLARGWRSGLLLGLGACSVDTGYILLISFGLITARPGPRAQGWLMLAGAAVLAALAVLILARARASARAAVGLAGHRGGPAGPAGSWRDYTVGVMMTAASPMNLVFWLGVIASGQYLGETPWGPWPRIVGVMCGTLGWVLALNAGLAAGRRLLRAWLLVLINLAGAGILLVFAGRGVWQGWMVMGR